MQHIEFGCNTSVIVSLINPDQNVRKFNEEVRETFDAAVSGAIKLEQQNH
jgi:hypothetical protein